MTEQDAKRALAVFGAWAPPDGIDIKGFYQYSDGSGGFTISEADDAAALARGVAAFTPWVDFTISPIVSVEEATAISQEAIEFRASVS